MMDDSSLRILGVDTDSNSKLPMTAGGIIEFRDALFLYSAGELGTAIHENNNCSPKTNQEQEHQTAVGITRKQLAKRDEKRRATHNEVERRRRDKINSWILKLGSIIPDPSARGGGVDGLSKGGILAAACEYIGELKEANETLNRNKEELRQENEQLRALLEAHGLHIQVPCASVPPQPLTKDEPDAETQRT